MKKLFIAALLIISLLLIAGCEKPQELPPDEPEPVEEPPEEQPEEAPEEEPEEVPEELPPVEEPPKEEPIEHVELASLQEAMDNGLPFECSVSLDGENATVSIEGEKYLLTFDMEDDLGKDTFYILDDSEMYYQWSEETKEEGISMAWADVAAYSEAYADLDFDDSYYTTDDLLKESSEVDCVSKKLPSTTFAPPSGTEFEDIGALFEDLKLLQEEGLLEDY